MIWHKLHQSSISLAHWKCLKYYEASPWCFSKDVLPGKHLSCWKLSCKLTVGEAESLKNDARCLHGDKMRLFEGSHLRFPGLAAAVGLYLVSLKKSIDTLELLHRIQTELIPPGKWNSTPLACARPILWENHLLYFLLNVLEDRLSKQTSLSLQLLCKYYRNKHSHFALILPLL